MSIEHLVEWELAGETEELVENLPQCHYTANSTLSEQGSNPGLCRGKPMTNRLSYGTASNRQLLSSFVISLYVPGSLISVKLIDYSHVDLIVRDVGIKLVNYSYIANLITSTTDHAV
jgi:hypothetical protein